MSMKYAAKVFTIIFINALLVSGCRQSPEEDIVVNKNEGTMEKIIQQGKASDKENLNIPETYTDSFALDADEIKVNVDAKVHPVDTPLPVVRVKPHVITAEEAKKWAEVLFEGKTAYEPHTMTKQEVEEKILWYKQRISDKEALAADVGEENVQSTIESYEENIADFEKAYESAPDAELRQECRWEFHPMGYYNEIGYDGGMDEEGLNKTQQLVAVTDDLNGHTGQIIVSNRDEEDYRLNLMAFYYLDEHEMNDIPYKKISAEEAVSIADKVLEKLGIEGWVLYSSDNNSNEDEGKDSHMLIYTPAYGDVPVIQGPGVDVKSEDIYASNYYYSSLRIDIYNGIIYGVEWISPLEEVKTESSDVETLPFEKVCEAFRNQMKSKYTRDKVIDPADPTFQNKEADIEVNITHITQGLFRIKEKDNKEEFLIVPVWCFTGEVMVNGDNWGESEFAMINAVDGSTIDTFLGY